MGRHVGDVTVALLDRPRNDHDVRELREIGARVRLFTDGDVANAIIATLTERERIDMLLGIGGAPEGVVAAATVAIAIGSKPYLPSSSRRAPSCARNRKGRAFGRRRSPTSGIALACSSVKMHYNERFRGGGTAGARADRDRRRSRNSPPVS